MARASMKNGIASLVEQGARLAGQRVAGARLDALNRLADGLDEGGGVLALFRAAWSGAGLEGTPDRLHSPVPADLPFAVYGAARGWCLLEKRGPGGTWQGRDGAGGGLVLERLDGLECLSLPRRASAAPAVPRARRLALHAVLARKGVFIDAVVATGLVTLLALATSLYSMQVFDRVIPNQGFETLWVLTVGVVLSILFEFMLKQVRSHSVDRACKAIDSQLSEWFFERMLGIRMEVRPASVGTLASQVKGFELVRGVLASTSIFVLADVPFALFFILVIFVVGGWVAAVPLVAMPLALAAGLLFQGAIRRHTRRNLAANHRTAGLLVEAVDGAESLKASSAEWMMQSRWNRLVAEASQAEQGIRSLSALSQNMTVALQQLSYIALVGVGAWLVTENAMTMGALLACSIIGNRAMTPIVQLPGVMVQWAHARAAIEGLDQVIALPNEADEAHQAIAPQSVDGGLRFERVRFTYGQAQRTALELERLEIRPGERVGLIGAIGSGKSTMLKLASGLYRPADGKVYLGGLDLSVLAAPVVRETVGYLPQEARLFSGTLRDNLLLGLPDPGDDAILEAARRTGLIDLLAGQPRGLALEIAEGGQGVSGGQKQLIALTRMLLARPKVWLMDEPTGAMDSVTEARVVALLREVAQEGATLVTTTHKTALLPLLDRLVVLQGGRVVADGPREAVLRKLSGRPPAHAQSQPQPQGEAA